MIKVENLCKTFRTEDVETIALNKVSFEVKDGEFVAIMGPSGCGKSTLLNILGLLDNPTSGKYWLNGKEVQELKEKDREGFGAQGTCKRDYETDEYQSPGQAFSPSVEWRSATACRHSPRRRIPSENDTGRRTDR